MKTVESLFTAQLLQCHPKHKLVNSVELIKQNNLQHYPNDAPVEELKRQQFILEHLSYLIQEAKDNL